MAPTKKARLTVFSGLWKYQLIKITKPFVPCRIQALAKKITKWNY
jgi:hypothetical protein